MRAAGGRSTGLPSDREQRTRLLTLGRRLGFGVLLRHQLGLSEQRGLVARARRPASAPLRRHGDGRVHDLLGETEVRACASCLSAFAGFVYVFKDVVVVVVCVFCLSPSLRCCILCIL